MSGIAFEFGDATYSAPNRSMSSYAKGKAKNGRDCGMFKEFQGFWLDVLVGPYISFGVEIEKVTDKAKQLFDVVNQGSGAQQQRHHTVDVAMYNLLSFMWMAEVRICICTCIYMRGTIRNLWHKVSSLLYVNI
jgi:dynein assembly factor 3